MIRPAMLAALLAAFAAWGQPFHLATFKADITVPLGHALMGGGIAPATEIVDPLEARGLVLLGAGSPLVFVSLDWCELRNDAYDRWRAVLAEAAGTDPKRVLLACIHQHDAPVADLTAQALLTAHGLEGALCDPAFHEAAVQRVAAALRASIDNRVAVTHIGTAMAEVHEVASNRRVVLEGRSVYHRGSATPDARLRAQPRGVIDPMLRTLSFWNGDTPLAAMHAYAVHPMSYYGKGGVSYDFPGIARARRQNDDPAVFQMYFSGCSGDVVAGKYNDGAPENRAVLAGRLYDAMAEAWEHTEHHLLERIAFHSADLRLPLRNDGPFEPDAMQAALADTELPAFQRVLAAMGLSWRKRVESGQAIDIPAVDFGPAVFLLLPAEAFVQYQLTAQTMAPNQFVFTAGYGESTPGYIPTQAATEEGFNATHSWCWTAEGAESAMHEAIQKVLAPKE